MLDSWSHCVILYNVRYTDHESNMASFCTMSDAQITSPTWRHSVQCQMHRSRVQHGVILYNVRCTDHESNMASFCTMSDAQITSPSIWHYTWWCNVGLVTYVSDIIQNDVGLVICVYDIIHDDAMLDSWSVYLTLYMMTQCWTRDLCIWHYTWWRNVGLVICVSGIIQNDVGLVICASDIIQNDVGLVICVSDIIQNGSMLDMWSVYLTLYRIASCWPCDLCIWPFTEWCHVGLVICVIWHLQNDAMFGLMICVSDIIQNDAMLD